MTTPNAHQDITELTHGQRLRAILTGSAGNLIEWYDFYVYAFLGLYFASSFFPDGDRTAQLLNIAGIYAAGFLSALWVGGSSDVTPTARDARRPWWLRSC